MHHSWCASIEHCSMLINTSKIRVDMEAWSGNHRVISHGWQPAAKRVLSTQAVIGFLHEPKCDYPCSPLSLQNLHYILALTSFSQNSHRNLQKKENKEMKSRFTTFHLPTPCLLLWGLAGEIQPFKNNTGKSFEESYRPRSYSQGLVETRQQLKEKKI